MTVAVQDRIDFTMMYATHHAFRRDLGRLIAAAESGRSGSAQLGAGWENFKTQLLLHHDVEDAHLWPRLRLVVAERRRDLTLVDEMEAEHARLDPLLAAIDEASSRMWAFPTDAWIDRADLDVGIDKANGVSHSG